jgi:serine phosphatase RsbU (regulator of sigma subunit)/DNA-binding response OmpR family regulator
VTTVLIVDDTESNRFIFGSWLRRAGYEVFEAASGGEGMALVEAHEVDLVLLDVNLPDMSGTDVCEWIKGRPETAAVPVIHASATATEVSDRSTGLNRGADVYMVEPIEREELLAQVSALLRYSEARKQVERLAGRLTRLHTATLELHGASDGNRLLAALAAGAASIADCEVLALSAVDTRGFAVEARPSGSTGMVRACGAAEVVAAAEGSTDALQRLAAAGLPVPDGATVVRVQTRADRPMGALVLRADDEVLPILRQLALAAALATENLRMLQLEHRIALTLQRSLLPQSLPIVPGLQVAARYDASSDLVEVGGDFYEVVEVSEGQVAVAIGDVQGHNLQAATLMAELRNALRAYFLEGHGPAAVLDRLNSLLLRFHPDLTATVACAVFSDDGRRMHVANAGHLPGVVADSAGARFLVVPGPLLGVDGHRQELALDLEPGTVVVFATDGLVERRAAGIDPGLDELRALVAAGDDDLERLCDRIMVEVGPGDAAEDDVALLAVRVAP